MAIINYVKREVIAKIVYYGPGLCGKTTNLVRVHENMGQNDPQSVGQMQSLATESDRTLFFDFVPIQLGKIAGFEARFQLFTVPGQVFYNETRRVVLKDCDGVVFVADSQPSALVNNIESLQNLEENLASHGKSLEDIPLVIQYNKQDLPDAMTPDELEEILNAKFSAPSMPASAFENWGVMETLAKVTTHTLEHLRETMANPKAAPPSSSVKRTYSKDTVDDDDVVADLLNDIAQARTQDQPAPDSRGGQPPPRKDGTVPGLGPVETSSIKPEDLLAEFDEPSMSVAPVDDISAGGTAPPPTPPPPPPSTSQPAVAVSGAASAGAPATPDGATKRVPTPMPAPPPPPPAGAQGETKATQATGSMPTNPMLNTGGGRTAEDLLRSLEDDDEEYEPGANGNGQWEQPTQLSQVGGSDDPKALLDNIADDVLGPADRTQVSMQLPNTGAEDLEEDITSKHQLGDAPPPPPPAADLEPDRSGTGSGAPPPMWESSAPKPPPPVAPPVAPASPPVMTPSVPSSSGALQLTLVEAGPASAASPGVMRLPLTLKNERDGSLTTLTINLTTDDLPKGQTSSQARASIGPWIIAILALLLAGAALGLTLAGDLLQNL